MVSVDGILRQAVFPNNSVIIILGSGAEHWLKNIPKEILPLKATKHAVQMSPGNSRAWYGMMHLVPESAIIQENPYTITFGDLRHSMATSYKQSIQRTYENSAPTKESLEEISIGCGFALLEENSSPVSVSNAVSPRRRRLQMVPDASYCNNSTNFFCWMSCLDVPDSKDVNNHLNKNERLYCMDTTFGAQDKAAVDACSIGHNTNCLGVWHSEIAGAPYQYVVKSSTDGSSVPSIPFCSSGTSMYMDGFNWNSVVCIIYLFPSWVLNTQGKLIAAAFGTLAMGIAVEFAIAGRKILMKRASGCGHLSRLIVSTLLYGLQLTLAYLLMLVVMTYSGQLFICAILGLMMGHFVVNFRNRAKYSADALEGATPCCQNDVSPTQVEESSEVVDVSIDSTRRPSDAIAVTGVMGLGDSPISCCCEGTTSKDDQ